MTAPVKVIVVGNTGVGKSFLANVLLGEDKFEHKFQSGSCTAKVESEVTFADDPSVTELIVYNIPGLIEADKAKIERNKKAIKEAFADKPELRTVVLFVFSAATGGRVTQDDCSGWTAIKNFLQPEAKKYGAAIGFIVNRLDTDEFFDDKAGEVDQKKMSDYCAATSRTIRGLCGANAFSGKITFIEKVPSKERCEMSAPSMVRLRKQMVLALNAMLPDAALITPDPSAEIELEAEKLKKEVDSLMQKLEHLKMHHDEEMKKQSAEHRDVVERIQADQRSASEAHAREITDIKRELERSKAEIEKHKEELDKARQRGSGDGLVGIMPLLFALMQRQQHLDAASPLMMPMMMGGNDPSMMMGGPRRAAGSPSGGGSLGWHDFRRALVQSSGHMSRADQSRAYQHYKCTGQLRK